MDVVTALPAGSPIRPPVFLWDDQLPAPLCRGVGILPLECIGQQHPPKPFIDILLVNPSYMLERSAINNGSPDRCLMMALISSHVITMGNRPGLRARMTSTSCPISRSRTWR